MYLNDFRAIARDANTGNWVPTLATVQQGVLTCAYCPYALTNNPGFVSTGGSSWGTATYPWIGNDGKVTDSASYFLNGWIYSPDAAVTGYTDSQTSVGHTGLFAKQDAIQNSAQTIMFTDGVWEDGWPNGGTQGAPGDNLPSPMDLAAGNGNSMMGRVCIARHGIAKASTGAPINSPFPGGVNVAIADGHVEYAKLDTLWSVYYWHKLSVPTKRPGLP
jgi:prepilin-type processing-associated H-X9-DG protein